MSDRKAGCRSPFCPDAIEQLVAVEHRLHSELRQQLVIKGAGLLEMGDRQNDMGHPVDLDCHRIVLPNLCAGAGGPSFLWVAGDDAASAFPVHVATHCTIACSARAVICVSESVLIGWSITTGTRSGIPSASRCMFASWRNSVVTTTAVGRPSVSREMPSCVQHDVHDPQSPIAVRTISLLAAISAISAGSAYFEKLSFL